MLTDDAIGLVCELLRTYTCTVCNCVCAVVIERYDT